MMELGNITDVKWFSYNSITLINILREFSDNKFIFIDNSSVPCLTFKMGANGYISFMTNILVEVELHMLSLLERSEFEKFEERYKKLYAWLAGSIPEISGFPSIGEGVFVKAILSASGKDFGPILVSQIGVEEKKVEKFKNI